MANAEDQVKPEDDLRPEISEVEPVDQETQPTEPQGSVPLGKHVKLRERAQTAEQKAQELERKIQALENERALESLAIQTPDKSDDEEFDFLPPPNPNDFYDDDELIEAQKKWSQANKERLNKQLEKVAKEQAQDLIKQQEEERLKTETQRKAEQEYQSAYDAMLERADKLNVDADEFLEAQESLQKVWSPWFIQEAVKTIPNAEQLILVLGKDLDKAKELADAFDANQFAGGQKLITFAGQLDPTQTRGDLPEPDEPVEGGAGAVTTYEKELAKKRELNRTGKMSMNELMEWKRNNQPKEGAA